MEERDSERVACPGRFLIDELIWKDGKLVKAVLRSETGGNLRLRSYWKLAAEGALLKQKKEEEANPNALLKYSKSHAR